LEIAVASEECIKTQRQQSLNSQIRQNMFKIIKS